MDNLAEIKPSKNSINTLSIVAKVFLGNNIKCVFEYGSRYGEDTEEFAKRYPNATIYAFECNPATIGICKNRLKNYSNVVFTEKAITEFDGEITFFPIDEEKTKTTWTDGNQGASSLLKASGKYVIEQYVQKKITVEGISLHTFIKQNDIDSIDIMWMDIQGAELMALRGLKEKIQNVKLIHIEVEFIEIYQSQPLFKDIRKVLQKKGFVFLGFTTKGECSADAIFLNRHLYKKNKYRQVKKILLQYRQPHQTILREANKIFKKIKIFAKKTILVILCKRGFDNNFKIYKPPITTNKRELLLWRLQVLNPILGTDCQYHKKVFDETPIDIIIPTTEKDINIFADVIKSAKRNIKHPIKNIFVIAPNNAIIKEVCKNTDCIYLDENSIINGFTKNNINYSVNGVDRSGWIFQQIIKLSGDTISTQEYFLVLDSDTIINRPIKFIHRGKIIFNHSDERHQPYYDAYERIMKIPISSPLSFISHCMLFSKNNLAEMKQIIERKNSMRWIDAILSNIDYSNISGFSEYELYGNFMLSHHKKKIKEEYWFNVSIKSDNELNNIPNFYKTVSYHSYNRNS